MAMGKYGRTVKQKLGTHLIIPNYMNLKKSLTNFEIGSFEISNSLYESWSRKLRKDWSTGCEAEIIKYLKF